MTTLIITIGLPGSGKTTRARAWVAEDPLRHVRVNRDDLRDMMLGGWTGLAEHEDAVTLAQHAAIRALLNAGYDVAVDDTNLHAEHLAALRAIGTALCAQMRIWDLTDVPVDECVARDNARAAAGEPAVGEQVIRGMWQRYQQRLAETGSPS